jgi:uroporphyrinogen decarboxylase
MEFSKLQARAGMSVRFLSRSPFNTGSDICGIELFCRWMTRKPDLCHRLIEMGMEHILRVLQYWVDTFGAENIFFLMSSPSESNQVISPRHFQEFAISYHREFQRKLRSMGIHRFLFHICGDQNMNLPYLAELAASSDGWPHPSILSFGHEVDLTDAAKYFPEDIIMGNIMPAAFQTGRPQEVYDLCRITIEKGKKISGGFILAPGCGLPPWAPPYNVWMMTKAVNDFGWY